MRITSILMILAGLCLALLPALGCGGDGGPIAPPTDMGTTVIISDDGDKILVANESVILSWEYYPRIDYWEVSYSVDGQNWTPSDQFDGNVGVWKIPVGLSATTFMVKVDGWKESRPTSQVVAYSVQGTIEPYLNEVDNVAWRGDNSANTDESFVAAFAFVDKYGNVIQEEQEDVDCATIYRFDFLSTQSWIMYVYNFGQWWDSRMSEWNHQTLTWVFDSSNGLYTTTDSFSEPGGYVYAISTAKHCCYFTPPVVPPADGEGQWIDISN